MEVPYLATVWLIRHLRVLISCPAHVCADESCPAQVCVDVSCPARVCAEVSCQVHVCADVFCPARVCAEVSCPARVCTAVLHAPWAMYNTTVPNILSQVKYPLPGAHTTLLSWPIIQPKQKCSFVLFKSWCGGWVVNCASQGVHNPHQYKYVIGLSTSCVHGRNECLMYHVNEPVKPVIYPINEPVKPVIYPTNSYAS